jgi:hypothetical protein
MRIPQRMNVAIGAVEPVGRSIVVTNALASK